MPRPTAGRPYTVANIATVGQQEIQCYELRLAGKTYRQVAEATGLSVGTVHTRISAHLAQRVQPLADELRAVEVDRLDRYLAKLETELDADPIRAIPVAVKVSERRARLLGIDAPQQVEALVTQVTQEDMEFAELIRDAQARAALAEIQLRGEL